MDGIDWILGIGAVGLAALVVIGVASHVWALRIMRDTRKRCAGNETAQRRLDEAEIVMFGAIMTRGE